MSKGYHDGVAVQRALRLRIDGNDLRRLPKVKGHILGTIGRRSIVRPPIDVLPKLQKYLSYLQNKKSWKAFNNITSERLNTETLHFLKFNQKMEEILKSEEITAEQIVREIAKIAFGKRRCEDTSLEGNEYVRDETKLKALEMLGRWAGIYQKDNAQRLAGTSLLQIAFVGEDVYNARSTEINKAIDAKAALAAPSKKMKQLEREIKQKIADEAQDTDDQ